MSSERIHTSAPDQWSHPRPYQDASIRRRKHGPVRPMREPGFIERLLGAR